MLSMRSVSVSPSSSCASHSSLNAAVTSSIDGVPTATKCSSSARQNSIAFSVYALLSATSFSMFRRSQTSDITPPGLTSTVTASSGVALHVIVLMCSPFRRAYLCAGFFENLVESVVAPNVGAIRVFEPAAVTGSPSRPFERWRTPVSSKRPARSQEKRTAKRGTVLSHRVSHNIDRLFVADAAYLPRLDSKSELFVQQPLELPCRAPQVALVWTE